jgi:HEAT repeat protein
MGLVKGLESANAGDRWTAVQSLGETRDPMVAEYLLPRLKDADIFVRMATARVLGDLGSTKAIPALIEALEDSETPVREAAYVALCTVSKKNLPFDALADSSERARRVKAWQDWWKKAKDDLGGG